MSQKKIDKKIFYSKEEYLNAIDIEDKKIDAAEIRIEELRRLLRDSYGEEEKVVVKTTTKKQSNVAKKKKENEIPVDKKHEIVSIAEFNEYNYDKRRREWHKKAGHNDPQVVCSICKDDDNWATVQLDDGRHICYYCWIKKPTTGTKKKTKSTKVKTIPSKKTVVKQVQAEPKKKPNTPPKKHEAVQVQYLDLYDYKKKLAIWKKSAGDNLTDQGCNKCGGKQYERTILLDDGRHICWYCWIRKPEGAISVSEYNKMKKRQGK